jgi:hypothetical protein
MSVSIHQRHHQATIAIIILVIMAVALAVIQAFK